MKKTKIILFLVFIILMATLFVSCGECTHEYVRGSCTKCGEAEPYYKAPCTSHAYVNGVCTSCGSVCTHESYEGGACASCKAPCTHSYESGACTVCKIPCAHPSYNGGKCTVCKLPCTHNYESGTCTSCGIEDPDYIPPDGGESMYSEIVEDFKYLILYKYTTTELPEREENEPFYMDALYETAKEYDPSMEMGYAFKDVDKDGYKELLLMGRESRVYAIFTVIEKAPVLVSTFQRGMGYLGPDGMVFYNAKVFSDSGAQIGLGNHMKHLSGGKLVGFEYGWTEENGTTSYYCTLENGEKTAISYDEYKAYRDNVYQYFWDYPTRLTKQNGLKFIPALITTEKPKIKADFSTYEAIILTFGLMHSEVAGGKYSRSDWISGKYDSKMIFERVEDYELYNRLIGAVVLVQNSVSAVFGYSEKDLNGDGTSELILMDNSYHVFAIFTKIDGKPVLLDAYNDLRVAAIDANGYIRVSERVIPGSEKDCEFFVYELVDGILVAKTAIGVKYSASGEISERYKTVDGKAVSIEESEWNTLYSEYISDIGASEFSTYTKNNSGLVFTAAGTAQ